MVERSVVSQFEIYLVIPGRGRSPRARNPGTQAPEVLGKIGVHGFRAPTFGRPRNDSPVYYIQTESLPNDRDDCAGRIAGAVGGEEGDHVGDLARASGADEDIAL